MILPEYKYILDGKTPVPCPDWHEWAEWYEMTDRRVAFNESEDVQISTVFLGLDHAYSIGKPQLFETMIFGGEHDGFQERCSTWDEAEDMHRRACRKAFGPQLKVVS